MDIDFSQIPEVLIRGFCSLITLFLVAKMLGKKQVSQLSLFDYVIGISIGNFAAEMTSNTEIPFVNGIFAVFLFGIVAYLVSYLTMKSIILRRFFMGVPTILVEDGKIIENGLKKIKFDINDLLEEIRSKGYFEIDQIECAIMEASGDMSVLPKTKYRPLLVGDTNLDVQDEHFSGNVIVDGNLMKDNIYKLNKTNEDIIKYLEDKKIKLEDVLLATLDVNDIKIYLKNETSKKSGILE